MNICYFSCSSKFGGVEKIIVDTANELIKTNKVLVILPLGCEFKNKFNNNVILYEYKSFDKRYNLLLYFEIYRILKKFDIKILHSHAAKATQISYILNNFINNLVHIATKHNIRKGKIFNKIRNVISVSQEVSKTINHETKIMYFGINPEKIEKDKKHIFTMIAVGRLDKIKGFDILIEQVSKLDFNFRLNIIGEGPEKSNLINLIEKKSLANKIYLLGFKNNINEYLKESHLQIISSLSEGLPITLIEGIHFSSVIISTPVGGIPEIINKDFLVNPDNISSKINDIHSDYDNKIKVFSSQHSKFKEILTIDNYIDELIKYYKNVLFNHENKII